MAQIIDADDFFQFRDMCHGFLKTILAKMLMLLLLYVFADGVKLVGGDNRTQLRK